MKVLQLPGGCSPREQGRVHGEVFRHLIAEIAEIRTELSIANGRFADAASVLDAARAHLPVLERFAPDLYEELVGIAEGANVPPPGIVVLNHYTDLKDLDPSSVWNDDDCSALYARTPAGPVLGQTWDMHGSAADYVMMLGVPARGDAPAAWLLSITGCLGMAGLGAGGVGITINNLRSTDARVGVVWPALVRRVLQQKSAEHGRNVVLRAPLGSGHHYLVASAGAAYGIEASGVHRKVVYEGHDPSYVHTNHCLDDEIAACTAVGPESTTHRRHRYLAGSVAERGVADRADLWERLGSHDGHPHGICTHLSTVTKPHAMTTCGAIAMDLEAVDVWGAQGCIHSSRPHLFAFDAGVPVGPSTGARATRGSVPGHR